MFDKKFKDSLKFDFAVQKVLDQICANSQIKMFIWNRAKKIMPYTSCRVNRGKCVFFFCSSDAGISNIMFQTKRIYEEEELDLFFRLTKKYYGYTPDERESIFLDIGGNIGTMSIAAKTKYNTLTVIGFEPANENAKLFRINAIINDKDIQLYNIALSDFNGTTELFINRNSCVEHILMMDQYRDASKRVSIGGVEQVDVMTLDSWCEKYEVPMDKVGYICLDVEGHESAVLRGGTKLFSSHAIPIWLEVSSEQCKNRSVDSLIKNVSRYYNFYIDKRKPYVVNSICKLNELTQEFANRNAHTDIFMIK